MACGLEPLRLGAISEGAISEWGRFRIGRFGVWPFRMGADSEWGRYQCYDMSHTSDVLDRFWHQHKVWMKQNNNNIF